LYQLCTRIGAICAGRLSPLAPTVEVTIEQLGQWMAGEFDTSGKGEGDHAAA
jgi:simple sugar transport system ATP-binding protein